MRLDNLVFVTSNLGKLKEAEQVLGFKLEHRALDLPEVQSLSLEEVVGSKAAAAYQRLAQPVLIEDTSLEISGMNGFPGPLVRWVLASVGAAGIARMTAAFGDARATVRCLACATNGSREVNGLGVVHGRIATSPRGGGGFGWDCVFIPADGDDRTFAEMSSDEKNAVSHRRRAFVALREELDR